MVNGAIGRTNLPRKEENQEEEECSNIQSKSIEKMPIVQFLPPQNLLSLLTISGIHYGVVKNSCTGTSSTWKRNNAKVMTIVM